MSKYAQANKLPFPFDAPKVHEFELYLLDILEFSTIVFHPYRCILQWLKDGLPLENSLLYTSWWTINDCYRADIPLKYPPHQIAISAIYFACSLESTAERIDEVIKWLTELNVDLDQVFRITDELTEMYRLWKSLSPEFIHSFLRKTIYARNQ